MRSAQPEKYAASRHDAQLSLRFRLRADVARDHETVERIVEERDFFSSHQGYRSWLKSMLDMHCAFAKDYDAGCTLLGLAPQSTSLLDALAYDFGGLWDANVHRTQRGSDAHCIGVAYTLEGSGLGAQVLLKRAETNRFSNTRYLTLVSESASKRWRHFTLALNAADLPFEKTAQGARAVFTSLGQHFSGNRQCL